MTQIKEHDEPLISEEEYNEFTKNYDGKHIPDYIFRYMNQVVFPQISISFDALDKLLECVETYKESK